MRNSNNLAAAVLAFGMLSAACKSEKAAAPRSFSGIYPQLAMYNNEGECGTGAVVPWAGKLWVVTYGPHMPFGSSDKLYEITPDHKQIVREESIGGTPANRMIHPESNQLFIGPYAISDKGVVRVIPYTAMPGRHTGNARHLTDPAGKIYYGTMEEGFYEVDVHTLKPTLLYEDGNVKNKKGADTSANAPAALLPGAHGKGLYSGQGVLLYANNGEPGPQALVQFDIEGVPYLNGMVRLESSAQKSVYRNHRSGCISGNKNPATDPIWTTGWDHKSVLLGLRDQGKWSFFRLPKASHSYDGAHGWNTEWPRIRDVGTAAQPDYLMTMHGMFWHFPGDFSTGHTAGIRPRSAYLKVIGDYTRWQDQLVFGCDDAAQKEFLNKRTAKGNIEGPGQSNSNLWFTSLQQPDQLGPNTAEGAVWIHEAVTPAQPSEPFLFAGWPVRSAHIAHDGKQPVEFTFETDNGNGTWTVAQKVTVAPGNPSEIIFPESMAGEWIRVTAAKPVVATAHFFYAANDQRTATPAGIFTGLSNVTDATSNGGLLYGLGKDRRALGVLAQSYQNGDATVNGYYELSAEMALVKKDDPTTAAFIQQKFAIPQKPVEIDASSVLVVDDKGRRWRLPLGGDAFSTLTGKAALRICREVSTERDLFNCHGTFYELPAENADGYAKIRPIASHAFRINDYAAYRGMLIMTGIAPDTKAGAHIIVSEDKKAMVWAGAIDDLWQLGRPTGHGGPWKNSEVLANTPSDPYLIGFYSKRQLQLSHDATTPVTFTIATDPVGNGPWMNYKP